MNDQLFQEIKKLITESQNMAIFCLKTFFTKLELDPEIFSHLYNIKIKLGTPKNNAVAEYQPDQNIITLNENDMEEFIQMLKENPSLEFRNNVILNIALSIVHEKLHANSAMLIKNGLNSRTLKNTTDDELLIYAQNYDGHSIELYNDILMDTLNKPYANQFSKYIPIKIRFNSNNTLNIIAYNTITKDFDQFENLNIDIKNYSNDKILIVVGQYLSNNNYEPSKTIYNYTNEDKIGEARDYYHEYSKKLVNSVTDIPPLEYAKLLDKKTNEVIDKLENQDGFEETFVETLANIIIISRKDQDLNLDLLAQKILNDNVQIDIKLAVKLIRDLGIDIIKWYITSAYNDEYNDEFYKIFQERYNDLLLDFTDLYQSVIYNEEPSEFSINDINEIIEEKIRKK